MVPNPNSGMNQTVRFFVARYSVVVTATAAEVDTAARTAVVCLHMNNRSHLTIFRRPPPPSLGSIAFLLLLLPLPLPQARSFQRPDACYC